MAESNASRLKRWSRGDFTKREYQVFIGGMLADQAIDVATAGRLSKLKLSVLKRAVLPVGRLAGRAAIRAVPGAAMGVGRGAVTAGGVVRTIAMRHPYVAAGAVIYLSIKERDKIAALAREGWEVVEDTGIVDAIRDRIPEGGISFEEMLELGRDRGRIEAPSFLDPLAEKFGVQRRSRKQSKFNKAVSKGMKAVKRSKFLGKPGKFTNPKKAFGTVTRVVSRVKNGAKVSTKGVTGVIKRAVKRIL